jgi:RNA recognition motif-containing protein
MNAMNQPNSLFLGDLSFYCHEDDIRAAFQVFGELTEARIMRKYDGRSLGYGFVTFKERYNAMRAMDALAGKLLIGRKLK